MSGARKQRKQCKRCVSPLTRCHCRRNNRVPVTIVREGGTQPPHPKRAPKRHLSRYANARAVR